MVRMSSGDMGENLGVTLGEAKGPLESRSLPSSPRRHEGHEGLRWQSGLITFRVGRVRHLVFWGGRGAHHKPPRDPFPRGMRGGRPDTLSFVSFVPSW